MGLALPVVCARNALFGQWQCRFRGQDVAPRGAATSSAGTKQ